MSCPSSPLYFPCRSLSVSLVFISNNMVAEEWAGCWCFNRYDQLTSLLHVSGAYHQAPCPERCFCFTGPPTPQLPLDVYTDPFIEDSLGLRSPFVFVCVCVCTTPLGHNTVCVHSALWSLNAGSVPPDHSQALRAKGCAMKE